VRQVRKLDAPIIACPSVLPTNVIEVREALMINSAPLTANILFLLPHIFYALAPPLFFCA
jgi:hypothetical protein